MFIKKRNFKQLKHKGRVKGNQWLFSRITFSISLFIYFGSINMLYFFNSIYKHMLHFVFAGEFSGQ